MIEPTALLRTCMLTLRELSGAGCVTLFVPAKGGESPATLLHEGDLAPVPELDTLPAATRLSRRADEDQRFPLPPKPVDITSADRDCLLVGFPPSAWLGLRFPPGERPAEPPPAWRHLFDLAAHLAAHEAHVSTILKDPVTRLAERQEFQSLLAFEIDRARHTRQELALLLVNPDDFAAINEAHGHETGDVAMREIADRLRNVLRKHDLLSRYGGATFTLILPGTALDVARRHAGEILSQIKRPRYLDGSVQLSFSIGLALFDPDDDRIAHPSDLVRRADQALFAAKRSGGNTCVVWDAKTGADQVRGFDRMAGIFTGDVSKDYRNMMLLWDTIQVVTTNETLDQLAEQTVSRLFEVLRPDGIGLFTPGAEGELELLRGLSRRRRATGTQAHLETLSIDSARKDLMNQALEGGLPREALLSEERSSDGETDAGSPAEAAQCCHAVPLIAGREPFGVLFIEWRAGPTRLDSSDLAFVNGLGLQIAMAWDRARLAELEKSRQELEKRQLRAELKELRQAVQQAKLVYRSPEMEELMGTARRVAGSDATILITGPSGTGKELLAKTIHELSDRKNKPLVIVDCGAIPTTLIESELFGHERGAYTGAQSRRLGRLAEADGGTVLLDEIGELPLEVQSKLLRFVQDKQFTSVGGSGSRAVDVRIQAATNRDLAAEVAEGRFREDLYYRLNVVHLAVPPLRDRAGDIMLLARHFLEVYSVQYQKNIHGLSPEAGQHLLEHSWPGNVRELQNRVMQAVLLCEGDTVTAQDLALSTSASAAPATATHAPGTMESREAVGVTTTSPPGAPSGSTRSAEVPSPDGGHPGGESGFKGLNGDNVDNPVGERLLKELSEALAELVATGGRMRVGTVPPLGLWLADELLLLADRAAEGVGDRGASFLDMPPSTYRRRLIKARDRIADATTQRPPSWNRVCHTLESLVAWASDGNGSWNLPDRCERALLEEITARFPGRTQLGCELLGVTPPTFRRRLAELEPADVAVSH